jgi:hypothetical protein
MTWEWAAEALILEALGGPPAATIVAGRGTSLPPGGGLASLLVRFVGQPARPAEREVTLAQAARALAFGGRLVVVDHNRPRRRIAALLALVAPPLVPGATPKARWCRLAYPVAREIGFAGFTIESLRLVASERVQIVFARRTAL